MTKQYTFQRSPLKGFKLHVLNLFQPQKQRQFYSRNQKPMGSHGRHCGVPTSKIGVPHSIFPTPSETHNIISRKSGFKKKTCCWLNQIHHFSKTMKQPAKLPWSTVAWSWSSRHCECRAPPRGRTPWPPLENYHGVFFWEKVPIYLSMNLSIYLSIQL